MSPTRALIRARGCPGSAEIVFSIRVDAVAGGSGDGVALGEGVFWTTPGRTRRRPRREARHEGRQTQQHGEEDEQSATQHATDASRMYEMLFSRG